MNIEPMLARLQSAMGRQDLIEQLVLVPEPASPHPDGAKSTKSVNLVVGYNRTPSSQTALDITLWIANETRLATQKQVTVHVVYVVDDNQSSKRPDVFNSADATSPSSNQLGADFPAASTLSSATPVLTQPRHQPLAARPRMTEVDPCYFRAIFYEDNQFEQADQILWQARSLANEWGGAFVAHLRFGCVSKELRKVVESEAAALLLLGCKSVNHPVVQKLDANFPCSVLGIPLL